MPRQGAYVKPRGEEMYFGQDSDKQGVQTTKDMLGKDTFRKSDSRRTIFPDISEGASALRMMEQGANPGQIIAAHRGGPKGDINLPAEKKKTTSAKAMKGRR